MTMTLRSSLLLALTATLAVPLDAQKNASATKKKDNPEIAKKIEQLSEIIKDRKAQRAASRDAEMIGVIDNLVQLAEDGLSKGDEKKLLKALPKVFYVRPLRDPQRIQIYRAAAGALGTLGGPIAAQSLQKVYDAKKPFPDHRDWVNMRAELLRHVGRTKHEGVAKFLYDEAARAHHNILKAAAGQALGYYEDAPLKLRKEIVSKMLIELGRQESRGTPIDPGNLEAQNAKATLAAIRDKWSTTLTKLTGQQLRSFQDWNKWYNKNKSKNKAWKQTKP